MIGGLGEREVLRFNLCLTHASNYLMSKYALSRSLRVPPLLVRLTKQGCLMAQL